MKKKLLLWMFCMVLLSTGSIAQTVTVTGKVLDAETNGPVPSVTINVKGTTFRTATDANGTYTFTNISSKAILVFSYIGYKQEEVAVDGKTVVNVSLASDYGKLDEVVVVGFGTKKKINIAGAIDQISGDQLKSRPIANVLQGLQGISPGLNITYGGGQPGAVPTINIRGYTSINGGSPLVVIDGIPATSTDDMLRLNPSDISSFTVLRDAASAAIYGARAAFGVILITTKQGTAGTQTITYNTFTSFGKPTVLPKPVTDPYIYSRVLETSTDNTPWDYVNYSDEHYRWAKERSENPSIADTRIDPTDPTKWAYMGSNDWYKYFFNDASQSVSHALSLSGGVNVNNTPVTYYLSADYAKDNGLNKLTDDYWDRYGLRSRVGFNPLSWLRVDNNLNIYETKRALPNTSITDLYYLQPTDVAQNPDGTWANTAAGRLAARLVDGGNNSQNMFGFHNITSATATALKGDLTINGDASFKRELWKTHVDSKKFSIGFGPNDVRQEGGNGYVRENNGYLYNNAYNFYTNYKKTLGDHYFGATLGYNQEDYTYSTVNAQRDVLISSSLPYLSLTSGTATASAAYSAYATKSVFSRLNYTFKEKYILEATGRYDGSSRFPTAKRWGFFPSASAAWIVSSEQFMEPVSNVLSTFKLRTSYGDLGNQNVGDFNYLQTLPTGLSSYLINGAQQQVITNSPQLTINPQNYTWERVSTLNAGTDIGLLKDKFLITFDYFIRDTKGMLVAGQELPGVLGTSVPRQNAADLRTKGWELSVTYRDRFDVGSKPFNFDAKLFISDSRSKITSFKNDQNLFSSYRVGQDIGEIWGLENDGVFRNQAEIDALDESAIIPWGALEIVEGWPKYKDLDGNKKIERGLSANDPKDLKIIGNSSDRYSVGANLNMNWGGFDVSMFLQGVLKKDFYPHHYLFWGPYQQPYANIYPWNLDFYRGAADSPEQMAKHSASYIAAGLANANPDSEYPVLQSWLADANYGTGLDIPQTKYLLNGAYLRVKNIAVGYTLPAKLTKRVNISRLRIFVSGENLYEFSSIKKYVDPEAINQSTSAWAYPYQRRYAVGLNLDF
ncbi:SusC/RagA family TonB-linked outer membrane protein [Pedobacter metabolipauper]|uniref:TonB-linked SusC/RagA family outer membrane protein n=1 Tax=Pedobacter metabolipauper TaxID=425513 RepID=A0A4R6SR37_9SPHI|nr:TonB-dependent receptor [Pedobacter metabolipauper]TDQ06708.1 TonB-linked SusC/RagA family outer membrane protein [Pedobacter metabolipauper]